MIRGYSIFWIVASVLLGGIAGALAFLVHTQIYLGSMPELTIQALTESLSIFAAATILATFFVPVFIVSDFVSKRSNAALAVSALVGAVVLGTLVMIKKKFAVDANLFVRGWNVYMYAIIMASFARIGWARSRSQKV